MTKEQQLMTEVNGSVISKYELIERHSVDGTPFVIVRTDEGYFVSMGQYRLTDFVDLEQCESFILTHDWNFLLSIISVLVEQITKTIINDQTEKQ